MDQRFLRGIREFNEGRFFEAHDILEDLWHGYREPDRVFLQGLIQMAVGFYHFENGNLKGARSQFSKACAKFEAFMPSHWGLATDLLHQSLKEHIQVLERRDWNGDGGFENLKRPRIELTSDNFLTFP